MKRLMDIVLSVGALFVVALPMLMVAFAVKVTSPGPALYWSDRVGRNNKLFSMPKFRSMRTDTPPLPTHLLTQGETYLTPIGGFLRRTSLDEFPQLWSILTGKMSVVGPRPALFNQEDLVALRSRYGVHRLRPGLTGWAQVNGRDKLSVPEKVALDKAYLTRQSIGFDLQILWLTVVRVVRSDGVAH